MSVVGAIKKAIAATLALTEAQRKLNRERPGGGSAPGTAGRAPGPDPSRRRRPSDGSRRQLLDALDRRTQGERDIEFLPYVGPAGRGLHIVADRATGQEILVSSAAGSRSFRPGASVPVGSESGAPGKTILGLPPVDRIGTHETGTPTRSVQILGEPNIIAADPEQVPSGATTAVTLTGVLLTEGIEAAGKLRAVILEEDTEDVIPDPLVTVASVVWVDAETVTCDLVVSVQAPEGYTIRFQVRR